MSVLDLPKVCVVSSNPICRTISNGLLMTSLFTGWPRDRLTQIYFPVLVRYQPEFDVCSEFRRIGAWGRVTRQSSAPEAASEATRPRVTTRHRTLQRIRKRKLLLGQLKLAQELWYGHSWLEAVLRRQLAAISPDVVYAYLGSYGLTRITTRACRQLGLPLFLHVGDDFASFRHHGGLVAAILGRSSERWFRRAVELARGCAAISPLMAREFSRRYPREWHWFTTLVDAETFDPSPRAGDGVVRLVFAGNLELGRWRVLRQLALALKRIEHSGGIRSRLRIHSLPGKLEAYRRQLEVPPVTELGGFVDASELIRTYHESDILVHVDSFDAELSEYRGLSLSAKLSQYLMAGRCILSISPAEYGSNRMIEAAGAGVCIDRQDPDEIASRLEPLLGDAAQRAKLGRNGRRWALEHLAAEPSRERFRRALTRAAVG